MNIHKAIIFATKAHEGQLRKGTDVPYIVHPMEVMQILTDNKCPESVIIAGLLHDTLEDSSTTAEEIIDNFGQSIYDLVKNESEDKSKTWQERKQATIDYLENATEEEQLICCADKLSNIKSIYADKLAIGDGVFDRFNAPKDQIKWYYQEIANALTKIEDYKMKQDLENYITKVFDDVCSDDSDATDVVETEIEQEEYDDPDLAVVDFFDDTKSPDPEKHKVGSQFWMKSFRMSDGVHLTLNKNNWGSRVDYMMRDDGYVETIETVKGEDMQRLMLLCDNAENGREVVEYIYKRFSPDGYDAYLNILNWFEENGIKASSWMN